MRKAFVIIGLALLSNCLFSCTKNKLSNSPGTQGPPYFPYVRTIVQNHCLKCHNPGGAGMPVILNTDTLIVQNAAAIKAAVNDPVSPYNKRMPENDTLSGTDIATIVNWFNAGGVSTVCGINN
jgi:uncharacterized membrane protein